MWPAARSIVSLRPSNRSGARASTRSSDGSPGEQRHLRRSAASQDADERRRWLAIGVRRRTASDDLRASTSPSRRRAPPPRRDRDSAATTTAGSRTCRCPGRRQPPACRVRCRVGRTWRERFDRWQRMSAVRPRARRSHVVTEADVDGARDVRGTILVVPPRFVLEIESAVDDRPGSPRCEAGRRSRRACGKTLSG